MRYLIILLTAATLLAGCAAKPDIPHPIPEGWLVPVPGSPGKKVAIIPIRRYKPIYPAQAIRRGLQGCVNVGFHLDKNGHPTQLRVFASAPKGLFDEFAIRTIAQWRFRTTDPQGHPIPPLRDMAIRQVIVFTMASSRRKARSILDWVCHQAVSKVLLAVPAPQAVKAPSISTTSQYVVDLVQMPTTPHESLLNGWVNVKFCIDEQGNVVNAAASDSSPRGLYDDAAIAAMKTWDFEARKTSKGNAVKTCGLRYHIPVIGSANLARSPAIVNQMDMAIPVRDLASGSIPDEGQTTLQYCVDKDGTVSDVKIIASKPGHAFDQAAIQVLHLWKYWPQTVNGLPVRACNLRTTIDFNLGYGDLVWIRATKTDAQ